MAKRPVKIPLKEIHPTEYLVPQDKLDQIAAHYDGSVESIKPILVMGRKGEYYPQNGNKRALFLVTKGADYVLGYVQTPEEIDADFDDCKALAAQAEERGVHSLDDLKQRIVNRAEFERLMKEREEKKPKK